MSKSLLLTILSVLGGWVTLLAVPAYPGLIPYTQPDGSTVMVRMQGDEWGVRYFSEKGHEMRQLPDGTLRQATAEDLKTIDSELESSNARRVIRRGAGLGTTYVPHKGNAKALVILVEFTDRKFSMQDPKGYYQYFLDFDGFNYDGGVGCVRDYFKWQSNGQLNLQFDVYGPVQMDYPISHYCPRSNNPNLVKDATSKLDGQINFADYAQTRSGEIDNVYIIFAGMGANYTGDQNTSIWPHNWNVGGSTGISTTYRDGKKLNHYSMTCELGAGNSPVGIGPFIHEFCHALGLPDHYNSSSGGAGGVTDYTPGQWDVMDQGCYLGGGRRPCNFSAHELMAMDWVQPAHTLTTQTANVILPPFDENKWFVKVETGRANDYYLLENRHQTGWDKDLPAAGMLIWHIDAGYSGISSTPNNDRNHMAVDLIRADNIYSVGTYGGDAYPLGSNTAFGANTTPQMYRWSSSSSSSKVTVTGREISQITRSPGTGIVQFKYNGGNDNNVLKPAGMEDLTNVMIRVQADPAEGGTVSVGNGSGTQYQAVVGDMIYIYATPNTDAGYRFVKWTKDGKDFSMAKNNMITVGSANDGGTYIAHFELMQGGDDGKYCRPTATPNPQFGNRYVNSLMVTAGSVETNISGLQTSSTSPIYQDKSSIVVKANPGQTIRIKPNAPDGGTWRHSYFYIDWDDDGFQYAGPDTYLDKYNNYSLKSGVDLMFFSNWAPNDGDPSASNPWYTSMSSFYDSNNHHNYNINDGFEIIIPPTTKAGKYRARYKCHWQSLNPCGQRDANTNTNNNIECMGGVVVDFTIEVEGQAVGEFYTYSATTTPSGVGLATINGSSDPVAVVKDGTVQLSALSWASARQENGSYKDYDFVCWIAPNGRVISNDYNFELTSSAATAGCYTASYKERTFAFSAVADPAEGGTALINDKTYVELKSGEDVNISATANDGYEFSRWVCPFSVDGKGPYTITKSSGKLATASAQYAGEYVAEFRFVGGKPSGVTNSDIYLREIYTEGAGDNDIRLTYTSHPGSFHNELTPTFDNSIRAFNGGSFILYLKGDTPASDVAADAPQYAVGGNINSTTAFIYTDWDRDGQYTLEGAYGTNPNVEEPIDIAHQIDIPDGLEDGDYKMRLLLVDKRNARDGSYDHINAYAKNVQYGGISYDLPLSLVTDTGVEAIFTAPAKQGIYDLQGRRLKMVPGPGIYIIDGRKVIVTR